MGLLLVLFLKPIPSNCNLESISFVLFFDIPTRAALLYTPTPTHERRTPRRPDINAKMGLKSFFQSRWFDPKFKTKVHILQFVLIAIIVALAIGKIVTRPDYIPMNRMDIVAVTMVHQSDPTQIAT